MPNTFIITIKKRGKDPRQFFKEVVPRVYEEAHLVLKESGEACAQTMKDILLASGYKLEKLSDAISSTFSARGMEAEVHIGKISDFPKGITGNDYWEAFDSGFKVTTANVGYFTSGSGLSGDRTPPIAGMSGQKWIHTGKDSRGFFMKPYKVIEPLKFVDIADTELRKSISEQIDKINKELEEGSR